MPTVAMVGAGSRVFTRRLVSDLSRLFADDVSFRLIDIDGTRLAAALAIAERIRAEAGLKPNLAATDDMHKGLAGGADYVVTAVSVGGREAVSRDIDIPARYGLRQTFGDTLGIGGVMRALRTIPVVLNLCRAVQDEAPNARVLNYTNPMSMVVMAVTRALGMPVTGLCHSIPVTAATLAGYLDVAEEELAWLAAGINHQAWFLELRQRGQDLYPRLRERWPELRPLDPVRFEIMRKFGYFPSESSPHSAEYVAFFMRSDRLVADLRIPVARILDPEFVDAMPSVVELREAMERGETMSLPELSHESAPRLIHSIETGTPRVIYVNVPNTGLIPNLPGSAVVEVPAVVTRDALLPGHVGPIPASLAGLNSQGIAVQQLTVEGLLERRREAIHAACMLDPNLSATLDVDDIVHLTDELIDAHGPLIPPLERTWSKALPLAGLEPPTVAATLTTEASH